MYYLKSIYHFYLHWGIWRSDTFTMTLFLLPVVVGSHPLVDDLFSSNFDNNNDVVAVDGMIKALIHSIIIDSSISSISITQEEEEDNRPCSSLPLPLLALLRLLLSPCCCSHLAAICCSSWAFIFCLWTIQTRHTPSSNHLCRVKQRDRSFLSTWDRKEAEDKLSQAKLPTSAGLYCT